MVWLDMRPANARRPWILGLDWVVRSPRNQLIDGGIPQSGLSRLPSKTDHHTTAGELGASSTVISLLDSPACIWSAWSCPSYPPCLSATPSPSPLPGHRVPVRGYIVTYNSIYYHIYVLPLTGSQSAHIIYVQVVFYCSSWFSVPKWKQAANKKILIGWASFFFLFGTENGLDQLKTPSILLQHPTWTILSW